MNVLRKVTKKESKLFGVCGGIGRYLDPELDPIVIRLGWIVLTLFNPIMLIIYLVLAMVLNRHEEPFNIDKWKDESQNFMDVKDNSDKE